MIQPGAAVAIAIAVDGSHVYWTGGPTIGRSNLDGSSAIQCFFTGTDARGGIAVDALGPSPGGGPSGELGLGKAKLNKKRGSAKLAVEVPGPGKLKLAQTKSVKGETERAGDCVSTLLVKPRGRAKKKLNRNGRTKVKAKVTFTPVGGSPDTQSKRVKLVKR